MRTRSIQFVAAALLSAALLSAALPCVAQSRAKTALKVGKIIPIASPEITNGVVLVENGLVTALGTNVEIPWDANVLDLPDRVVMPGFIEPHTWRGMDRPNENVPEVPFVTAADALEPLSSYFEDALRDGIVAELVIPGNDTLFGGTGIVVRPYGMTVEEMTVRPYTGLKLSMRRGGDSRMGQLARFRKYMVELQDYQEERKRKEAVAKGKGEKLDEEIDNRKQPVIDLLDRKLKAFVYCETAADVPRAIQLADEYKFDLVLVLGEDCWKAAKLIAERKLPCILPPQLETWETNEATHEEERKILPKIFTEAGAHFAFQTDFVTYGSRFPWFQAAFAVRYGMSRDEALKAMTLYPAQLLNIDDRFGSLAKGKEANLIVLTGDPLEATSWVDKVMLGGEIVYERDKDKRLKKLLEPPKKPEAKDEPKEEQKSDDAKKEEPKPE